MRRKLLSLLLSLVCTWQIGFVAKAETGDNLVVNGGFEMAGTTESAAQGWTKNGSWKRIENIDGTYVGGCASMQHSADEVSWASLIQEINIEAESEYILEFYYRIDKGKCVLKETLEDTKEIWLSQTGGEFERFTQVIESGNVQKLKINFMDAANDLEMYLDEVKLTLCTPESETVMNGEFEDGHLTQSDMRPNFWATDSTGWFAVSDEEAYKGNNSMKIFGRAKNEQMGQYIEVEKNTPYCLNWYDKGAVNNYKIAVWGIKSNEPDSKILIEEAYSSGNGGDDWKANFLSFSSREFCKIRVEVINTAQKGDAVYLDSFSLIKLMYDEDVILNGDFENNDYTAENKWTMSYGWHVISAGGWGYVWPHHGGGFLVHRGDTSIDWCTADRTVGVLPNKIYTLIFYYKANDDFGLLAELDGKTAIDTVIPKTVNSENPAQNNIRDEKYSEYRINISTQSASTMKIKLRNASSAWIAIDDIQLLLKGPIDETVLNSGFEDTASVTDNSPQLWNTDPNSGFVVSNEEFYGGRACAKTVSGSDKQVMKQNIAVAKDTSYSIAWYSKGDVQNCDVTVYGLDANNTKTEITAFEKSTSACNDWQKNILYFNSGDYAKIQAEFSASAQDSQCVYIDDVTLQRDEIEIYVSPNGDDNADGSEDYPLLTLEGARDRVRYLKGTKNSTQATVVFEDGDYKFKDSVNFTDDDSKVVYKARNNTKVSFSGAMRLDMSKAKPVTNKAIRARMYSEIVDKVIQIDLNEQGFPYQLEHMDKVRYANELGGENTYREYVNIYLNDKPQTIAQWPDGENNFAAWTEAVTEGDIQGGKIPGAFRYKEDNPNRWKKADNVWISGFHSNEYLYERTSLGSIDTENKIITLAFPASSGVNSTGSRRWKAFNLLEELNMPGEWFIDVNTMILYYYPPKELKDDELEISYLNKPMIDMTQCSGITFCGIKFEKSRSLAVKMTEVSDITLDKCTFTDMESTAVVMTSTKYAETDSYWWQRQQVDAAYDCRISNCGFYNIGGRAIELGGGNVDTLTPGNNFVENCVFSNIATNQKYASVIKMSGCGNKILHNNIGNASDQAIYYFGNDHEIKYNEIYNTGKCFDDMGAIYIGRNYNHRGTEIAYNYIHDIEPDKIYSRGYNPAVYLDDSASGQNVHHNIIKNACISVSMSGQMNSFTDNIIINASKYGLSVIDDTQTSVRADDFAKSANGIKNKELYFLKYKNMDIGYTAEWGDKNAFNDITENLIVNASGMRVESCIGYGKYENNVQVSECNDFVDAEKGDYRIKKGSETLKNMPGLLSEDFDINSIGVVSGIDENLNAQTAGFDLVYPGNDDTLEYSETVNFSWERAKGANRYRLTVATDKEFNNVVYDNTTYYTYQNAALPKYNGQKYYWKVYAVNLSHKTGGTWECSGVFSFKNGTADEFELGQPELKNSIGNPVASLQDITDSTLDVSASIKNNYGDEDMTAIIALYNEKEDKNTLLNVFSIKTKLIKGKETKISGKFKNVEVKNGKLIVAVMLWDDKLTPHAKKTYAEIE